MKRLQNFRIVENRGLAAGFALLVLTPEDAGMGMPECRPGQFVQVAIDAKGVMLRRPISINRIDRGEGTLWLLVRRAGRGTEWLVKRPVGSIINLLLPLGNGFTLPQEPERVLLIGGGVGVAPLLQLGRDLKSSGIVPEFLLGARSKGDLLELEEFEQIGKVHTSTDDGSFGTRGLVTENPILADAFSRYYVCGPAPMMKAVARVAREKGVWCEVSLENMMACGVGACLCCVEKTVKGNVCVCTEGPVFNINDLTW